MKTPRISLRVVFYKEEGTWVAHCLEFDLIGGGETREAAIAQLTEAIQIQIATSLENLNPGNLFFPAESRFLQMFAEGEDVGQGKFQIVLETECLDAVIIERTEVREYLGDLVPA